MENKPTLIEIHFEKFKEKLPKPYYDTVVWVTDDCFDFIADGNEDEITESINKAIEEYELDPESEMFEKFIVTSIRCNKTFDDEDKISLTSLICMGNFPDPKYSLRYKPLNPFGEGTKVYVKWMVGDDFVDYYLLEENGNLNYLQDWSEEDDKVFDDFDTILNEGIEELINDKGERYLCDLDDIPEEDIDKYFRKGMMIE